LWGRFDRAILTGVENTALEVEGLMSFEFDSHDKDRDIRGPRPGKRTRLMGGRAAGETAPVARAKNALASAVWHIHNEMFGAGHKNVRPFGLSLEVTVQPGTRWEIVAEPSLEVQIRSAVRDMASERQEYRRGRVYCFWCESSSCPHSVPPSSLSVFAGYSSTGTPQWQDLVQALLALEDPRADRLFGPPPNHLVAAYIDPESLKHRQLNVFGRFSKTYDILGQVIFGFLSLRPSGLEKGLPERVAFTLQAVECRHPDGSPRLEVNLLGQMPDGSAAADALAESHHERILRILAEGRRRIDLLGSRVFSPPKQHRRPSADPDLSTEVERILKGVACSLERAGRQKERRTVHAEARSADRRPTSQALADASHAPDEHLLWDVRRKTVVVCGPRNRVHIFSPDGRHITSMSLQAELVRSRVKRGRWLPLSDELRERFRASRRWAIHSKGGAR